MTGNDLQQAALAYAKRGRSIFPVIGKVPHGKFAPNGFKSATNDAAKVAVWFANGSPPTGVAMEPATAGLVVIDIDGRNDGFDTIPSLERRFGSLPETSTVITPGGGEHRYFTIPEGVVVTSRSNAFGDDFPGIDVKSHLGYVVLPPSRHPSGGVYAWDASNAKPTPIPQPWLDALLDAQRKAGRAPIAGVDNDERILSGARRDTLLRFAGRLRHNGTGAAAIEDAVTALNRRQCDQPLPEDEVRALARDIAGRYETTAPLVLPNGLERDVKSPRVRTARLVAASSITPIERDFTVYPYVPQGEATWFEGSTKSGKTMVALDIASRVSHGRPFVNGEPIKCGNVAILTCEDDVDGTIVPRLIAAGADCDRVSVLRVSDGETECVPRFLTDLPTIEAVLKAGKVSLVIVDGTFGMLGAKDANAYGDAYATMVPFVAMLRRVGCGAIIIRHVRKTDASALHRGIGSVGFGALARSTISIAIDRDDEARRIFAHAGSNLGESGATYAFRVEGVGIDGFERTVGRVVWGETVDVSADDAMMNRAPDDAAERDVAVEFLQSFLGIPTAASDVFEAAEKRRIARRTLQRAAKRCGVIIERRGFPSGSLWHPPLASEQSLTQNTPNPLSNAQSRHTYKPGATDEMATGGAPQTLTLQGANSRATVAPLLSGGATVGATGSNHGALPKASVPDADDIEVFE